MSKVLTIGTRRLADLGYGKLRDYHEGKADWIAAGPATESGVPAAG